MDTAIMELIGRVIELTSFKARFGSPRQANWQDKFLIGSETADTAVHSEGGLSANAAMARKPFSKELHREFEGTVDCSSANLCGHTLFYSHFQQSRVWTWISGSILRIRKLAQRPGNSNIFLHGHSTGGLVMVVVAYLLSVFPNLGFGTKNETRIHGVIVSAPAFRIQSRLDTTLLWLVVFLYYFVSPLSLFATACQIDYSWPICLIIFLLHVLMVPRIWIPNGEARAVERGEKTEPPGLKASSDALLIVAITLYYIFTPLLFALLSQSIGVRGMMCILLIFLLSLLVPLLFFRKTVLAVNDSGYNWLPVVTASHLVILQVLARWAVRRLECPILLVDYSEDQVVVPVEQAIDLQKLRSTSISHRVLNGYNHSTHTVDQQRREAAIIACWIREQTTGV